MALPNPLEVVALLGKTFPAVMQNPVSAGSYDPHQDDSESVPGAQINVDGSYYQGGSGGFEVVGEAGAPVVYEAVMEITPESYAAGIAGAGLTEFPILPNITTLALLGITYNVNAMRLRTFNGKLSGYQMLLGR